MQHATEVFKGVEAVEVRQQQLLLRQLVYLVLTETDHQIRQTN